MSNMFCINKKSAGAGISFIISFVKNQYCCLYHNAKLKMSWQAEKEKYLAMTGNKKNPNCIHWETIPTWVEFAASKTKLVPKINTLPENNINSSVNDILAEKISVFFGDITQLEVDAIVNAANNSLLGGGGVDGAIHAAAGKDLVAECKTLNGCETGEAKITGGYKLPAKYVIHTVGPKGEKPPLLKSCYNSSLSLALQNNIRTIAFPCISTGIYGYPNKPASYIACYTVRKFLEDHADKFDRIIFCLFLDIDKEIYEAILQSYFPIL